ncbi:histidine kinase [Clostridium estertheticum]|uniref:LytS/YhcK type 5TM receptor domain-containing protein n=1 Tax=Clostridium estertheticum TaxID=238834 RepID=UPI0013E976E4|nr:LytS/YhcK type 5TM receptor domain-containing protein [Clostridium estertheticum]MBZ9686205.1 histidine kinase [Clostridium estertheticum]
MIELLRSLTNNLGYVILIAFFVSRIGSFKNIVQKDKFKNIDLIMLSIIFGSFGILGTYTGTEVNGAIANTRIIGVMAGGILCGPFVGVMAGVIAGMHRLLVDLGGITSIPCTITTIISGIIAGRIYKISNENKKWVYGLIGGLLMEILEMLLILTMAHPFSKALTIVKSIYFPMSFTNAIGIAILIVIIQKINEEKEEIAAKQAQIALEIANKTLPYFREMDENSLEKICGIIRESIDADAVSITNTEYILAHVGVGADHHIKGHRIVTQVTKKVIKEGNLLSLTNANQIDCPDSNCKLKSAIIAPLKEGDKMIGTLKIYYCVDDVISFTNINLALGLSQIISTQLEISKLAELKHMANKAEIKALQAQINPHFLFNALNTIISFIRLNPNRARELIINLSTYLRYNLEAGEKPVDIYRELEQVKAYIEIEKARFGEKLNIIYNIEDNLDVKIPSLIIQPIVENAIKHGILEGSGYGTVTIEIKKTVDDNIMITIEDDGVGISNDIIEKVYESKMEENRIGMSNVHNRLKYIYGEGLKIERLVNGTRIHFNVRKIRE